MNFRAVLIYSLNAVVVTLLITNSALACLWDRDTLAAEAAGLPGVIDVIVGRFERNPDLFYLMRLERVADELESQPSKLNLYDDAAVAADRLYQSNVAIEWMARKKTQLNLLDKSSEEFAEHEYRYLANLGTFHIHRWLRNGANRDDMSDVELARDLIAAAIELNPDAHFGRERYQLLAIEWVLEPPMYHSIFAADENYGHVYHGRRALQEAGYEDAINGLAGLIVLGDAWQSVDIFGALRDALIDEGHASVARMAELRIIELMESGKESLHPEAAGQNEAAIARIKSRHVALEDDKSVQQAYAEARENADTWHDHRTQFMLAKLEAGQHPDTHSDFWNEYEEVQATSLPNRFLGMNTTVWKRSYPEMIFAAILAIFISSALVWVFRQNGVAEEEKATSQSV